jgi:hypothetical protein
MFISQHTTHTAAEQHSNPHTRTLKDKQQVLMYRIEVLVTNASHVGAKEA